MVEDVVDMIGEVRDKAREKNTWEERGKRGEMW